MAAGSDVRTALHLLPILCYSVYSAIAKNTDSSSGISPWKRVHAFCGLLCSPGSHQPLDVKRRRAGESALKSDRASSFSKSQQQSAGKMKA